MARVLFLFAIRAAYVGFVMHASSAPGLDCNLDPRFTDTCDVCQPLSYLMFSWSEADQEIPAIISAFSSAALIVVSVWFMLTADEKHLLRTGLANAVKMSLTKEVVKVLHEQIGLSSRSLFRPWQPLDAESNPWSRRHAVPALPVQRFASSSLGYIFIQREDASTRSAARGRAQTTR